MMSTDNRSSKIDPKHKKSAITSLILLGDVGGLNYIS